METLDDARAVWEGLESRAVASPYQAFAFALAWFETIGAARGAKPFIVVAKDERGEPAALLPLARRNWGPVGAVGFLGGKDANFNLGLFRSGAEWTRDDVAALLRAAAKAARPRVDLFIFVNSALEWQGAANPLALLPGADSPSFGYKSALPHTFAAWFDAHYSKESQKKLRKKAKRLAEMGAIKHEIAADDAAAQRILDAFLAQKRARMRAVGLAGANAYDSPAAEAFLARLAGRDGVPAPLELHSLNVGGRIVATFGALASGDRLCGLFTAFDGESEIARCSPGELLVHEAARSAIARGFRTFDLGVGEARYKSDCCEAVERLIDIPFAATGIGRLAAIAFRARQAAKTRLKRSPRFLRLAARFSALTT